MSASHEPRDSANSTTSQLLFALLAGNLLAVFCVSAFRPSGGSLGNEDGLVIAIGVMSIVAAGLLFLASAMRRRSTPWWIVVIALNVTQIAQLLAAVVAITAQTGSGDWSGSFWVLVIVPLLGVLSAVGLVVTLREGRRARRRRLARAV